jgi:hypothetical protein
LAGSSYPEPARIAQPGSGECIGICGAGFAALIVTKTGHAGNGGKYAQLKKAPAAACATKAMGPPMTT